VSFASAQLALVLSSRRVLVPATLLIFAIVGVDAYRPNPVQGSFAVTAALRSCSSSGRRGVVAWGARVQARRRGREALGAT
jgi:hypothetical protein